MTTPPTPHGPARPLYQRALKWGTFIYVGVSGFGAILDAFGNSSGLSTSAAVIMAGLLIAVWAGIEVWLRRGPRLWVTSGGAHVWLSRLGWGQRLIFLGVIGLLCAPQFFWASHVSRPHTDVPEKQPVASKGGEDKGRENVQVVRAFLTPRPNFFMAGAPGTYETANLNCHVRNYGDSKLLLTSMEVEVVGGRDVTLDSGSSIGQNMLGHDPNRHQPVLVDSGKTSLITYDGGLHLPRMASFFIQESAKMDFVLITYDNRFKLLSNAQLQWVPAINQEFKTLYGDVTLRVNLFSNFRQLVKSFDIKLASGQTILEHEGNFAHDIFLGEGLGQIEEVRKKGATFPPG